MTDKQKGKKTQGEKEAHASPPQPGLPSRRPKSIHKSPVAPPHPSKSMVSPGLPSRRPGTVSPPEPSEPELDTAEIKQVDSSEESRPFLKAWGDLSHNGPITVVIDPGHGYQQNGWYDCGAQPPKISYFNKDIKDLHLTRYQKSALQACLGQGCYESDIVMRQANALRGVLEARNYKVVFTRDDHFSSKDDPHKREVPYVFPAAKEGLAHRVNIAKTLADKGENVLFISLHADARETQHKYKTKERYTKKHKLKNGKYKTVVHHKYVSHSRELRWDPQGIHIFHQRDDEQSAYLSHTIAAEFNNALGTDQDNHQVADSATVKNHRNLMVNREAQAAHIPSVLIEVGCLTNLSDFLRINDGAEVHNIAQQIADAVDKFRSAQQFSESMNIITGGQWPGNAMPDAPPPKPLGPVSTKPSLKK